jgi:hypothetical protein
VDPERTGKAVNDLTERAALNGLRAADKFVLSIGLPSLALEPPATLLGGHGRIGPGIRVRKDRISILVCRDGATVGNRTDFSGLIRSA